MLTSQQIADLLSNMTPDQVKFAGRLVKSMQAAGGGTLAKKMIMRQEDYDEFESIVELTPYDILSDKVEVDDTIPPGNIVFEF